MIATDIEEVQDQIPEYDIYRDALDTLVNRLRDRAKTETEESKKITHIIHQITLIRSSIDDCFYDELSENVQDRLRELNIEADDNDDVHADDEYGENEASESLPFEIRVLIRGINGVDLKRLFNTDYGMVQQTDVSNAIIEMFGEEPDTHSDSINQLATLLQRILQEEYDNLDEEYRDQVGDMYHDIHTSIDEGPNPLQQAENKFREYNIEWHRQNYDWPKGE
jgi:hypothetical protein